ncbi:MAG: hypothetical protein WC675_04670 [Patescibacteria group bacterium]|jgi:hypothetical protein
MHQLAVKQQPDAFVVAINEGALSHGAEASGTLKCVQVMQGRRHVDREAVAGAMFLCEADFRPRETFTPGDGTPVPAESEVVFVGLDKVPKRRLPENPGFYDVHGVTLSTNGRVAITFGSESIFVPVPAPRKVSQHPSSAVRV